MLVSLYRNLHTIPYNEWVLCLYRLIVIYTQYPIMTKQKQAFRTFFKCIKNKKLKYWNLHNCSDPLLNALLNPLWQRLQPWVFLDMTHTCIWVVSPILLCRSSQDLSGWMGSVAAQLFAEMFNQVQVRALATQGHSETCPKQLLWCLGCVLRVIVLFEGEPSLQSEAPIRFSSRISPYFALLI
jgi:hypothetical protein